MVSGGGRSPVQVDGALLAGGLGTRLRSVLPDRPKALAPVRGRPMVAYLLDQLCDAGIENTVLCVGYLAAMIEQALGSHHRRMSLQYSCESEPLGTGGALRNALPCFTGDTILVMNGDSWCQVELKAFIAAHQRSQAEASLVLVQMDDASRYGRVLVAADNSVEQFEEKKVGGGPGLINAGIYLLSRDVIANIPTGRSVSLEREVFPELVQRRALQGFVTTGKFIDIGTPESFELAATVFP
ncbi:MAG TPA: nucleotidyltransferase family protein [Pirellulales bacterium]|nr:nucleotidyltransferase family protein [Pirellulales bacterium]